MQLYFGWIMSSHKQGTGCRGRLEEHPRVSYLNHSRSGKYFVGDMMSRRDVKLDHPKGCTRRYVPKSWA